MLNSLPGFNFLGFIPYDTAIIDAEISNSHPLEASQAGNKGSSGYIIQN